jgi:hypothetical protein
MDDDDERSISRLFRYAGVDDFLALNVMTAILKVIR